MSNLANIETKNIYQLALQSGKISEMKKSELVKELNNILTKTYFDAGQIMPGFNTQEQTKNLQVLSVALYDELQQFKFLRIEELKIAFKNGVRGEYGEFFGINIKTFYQWLKGYQNDEKRKAAIIAAKAESEKEYSRPVDKKKVSIEWWEMIKREHSAFKNGGKLYLRGAFNQFKLFEEVGIIKLSNAEKYEWIEKAKLAISKSRIDERLLKATNRMEYKRIISIREAIAKNELTTTQENEIKSLAIQMVIEEYYLSKSVEEFEKIVAVVIEQIKEYK